MGIKIDFGDEVKDTLKEIVFNEWESVSIAFEQDESGYLIRTMTLCKETYCLVIHPLAEKVDGEYRVILDKVRVDLKYYSDSNKNTSDTVSSHELAKCILEQYS